jgi:hypothetical protein
MPKRFVRLADGGQVGGQAVEELERSKFPLDRQHGAQDGSRTLIGSSYQLSRSRRPCVTQLPFDTFLHDSSDEAFAVLQARPRPFFAVFSAPYGRLYDSSEGRSNCRRGRMRPTDLIEDGGAGCGTCSRAVTEEVRGAEHVLLSASWFGFIVGWALRHALRHADYLTLVTIRASREHTGLTVDVGSPTASELADVIGPAIRGTDFIGELDDGRLGLLFTDADDAAACRIIQRCAEVLEDVQFSMSLAFEVGAASCPTNGVDLNGLVAHATSHPVLNVRPRPPVLADRFAPRDFIAETATEPTAPHALPG